MPSVLWPFRRNEREILAGGGTARPPASALDGLDEALDRGIEGGRFFQIDTVAGLGKHHSPQRGIVRLRKTDTSRVESSSSPAITRTGTGMAASSARRSNSGTRRLCPTEHGQCVALGRAFGELPLEIGVAARVLVAQLHPGGPRAVDPDMAARPSRSMRWANQAHSSWNLRLASGSVLAPLPAAAAVSDRPCRDGECRTRWRRWLPSTVPTRCALANPGPRAWQRHRRRRAPAIGVSGVSERPTAASRGPRR